MKNILNLSNVQVLSKTEQQNIIAGGFGSATCNNGARIESNTSVSLKAWRSTVNNFCGHQGGTKVFFFVGDEFVNL